MSRITGVIVALAATAAVMTTPSSAATVGATAPPSAPELPREVRGGVEVTLADGDTFRVWVSDNHRAVRSRRRDSATGAWGDPRTVLRRSNLFCGAVDVRTANGAVAVTALCDRGGYSEDTAPTSSQALWSADTLSWSSYELEGEAYEEPGISPDGVNAVWPERGGYVVRTAAGFGRHRLDARGQEYTTTATITDAEQVSYLYGAQRGGRCRIVILSRTGDATPIRQELPLADACSDSGFENLDADTAWFGDLTGPASRSTIARADATSPWAVTQVAPASAPGLVRVDRRLHTDFFTAPGLPLIALASAGGRRIRAQLYDPDDQIWGSSSIVHDAGAGRRCTWGDNWVARPLAVLAATLTCGGRNVVLTTRDGSSWQALRMGDHPYGLSPDGTYVAVPGRTRTHVISPELGVVSLPGGVTGRCDVVVPDGPDAAVLLTAAGRNRGWPTVLQRSSPAGWTRLSRTTLPRIGTRCSRARSSFYDLPYRFEVFGGRDQGYAVRIVERDGVWTVRRSRW